MSKLTDYSKFDHLLEEDSDDENDEKYDKKAVAAAPAPPNSSTSNSNTNSGGNSSGTTIRRDTTTGRYRFEYNGNTIYEFEQSLDDVTIYVIPPPFITKGRQINCIISPNHLKLGLVVNNNNGNGNNANDAKQQQQQQQQQSWFLNEDTYGTVDVDESTWTLEDDDNDEDNKTKNKINNDNGSRKKVIVITLTKANRGTAWEGALKGNPNAAAATSATTASSASSNTMDAISVEQVKKDLLLEKFQEENPGFDFRGADFNGSVPDARKFMGGVQY